jgi:hypothetical protein
MRSTGTESVAIDGKRSIGKIPAQNEGGKTWKLRQDRKRDRSVLIFLGEGGASPGQAH